MPRIKLRYYRGSGYRSGIYAINNQVYNINALSFKPPVDYYLPEDAPVGEISRLSAQGLSIKRSIKIYDGGNNPNLIANAGASTFTLNLSNGYDANQDGYNGTQGRLEISTADNSVVYQSLSLQRLETNLANAEVKLFCKDILEDLKKFTVQGFVRSNLQNIGVINLKNLINSVGNTIYGYNLWNGEDLGDVVPPEKNINFYEWFNKIGVFIPGAGCPMSIIWDVNVKRVQLIKLLLPENITSSFLLRWEVENLVGQNPKIVDGRDQIYNRLIYKYAGLPNNASLEYYPTGQNLRLYSQSVVMFGVRTLNLDLDHIGDNVAASIAVAYIFNLLAIPRQRINLSIPMDLTAINIYQRITLENVGNSIFLERGYFKKDYLVESWAIDLVNRKYDLELVECLNS